MGPRRSSQLDGKMDTRGGSKRKATGDDPSAEIADTNKRKRMAAGDGRDARQACMDKEEGEVGDQALPAPKDVQLDADLSAEDIQMMTMMGIPFGFGTTQGKKVEDEACNAGAVKVNSKRTARQYMNRKGGHNKNLPSETNR